MSLKGRVVRINVSEPFEWYHGDLFGTIEEEISDTKLKVRLTKEIDGSKLKSNLIELRIRYEKENFKPLLQNDSVTIGGALIEEISEISEYIIIGRVTLV